MNKAPKFEATFTNLDLSEFASASASASEQPKSTIISASAQLIQIKKQEALHKQREEDEEALVQHKAAMKAQDQLKRLQLEKDEKQQREECMPGGFYGALVEMHGGDRAGAKKEKSGAKTKAQKRTVISKVKATNTKHAKKGLAALGKKSKRSKF